MPQGFPACLDKAKPKAGIFGSRTRVSGAGAQRGSPGAVTNLGLSSHPRERGRGEHGSFGVCKTSHRPAGFLGAEGFAPEPLSRRIRLPRCCRGVCPTGSIPPARWASLRNPPWAGGRGIDPGFSQSRARLGLERSLRSAAAEGGERAGSPGFACPRNPTQGKQ